MRDRYVFADEAGNFDLVADYCTWAIQRRWEREDKRSHSLIAPKIRSEFDVWAVGEKTYY